MIRDGKHQAVVIAVVVIALLSVCCAFAVMSYVMRRIHASDTAWVGSRAMGMRLLMYAAEHGGSFPVSLEENGFAATLDADDRAYLQHLRPQYRPPATVGTNAVEILAAQTRWERVVFWSDGNLVGVRR